VGCTAGLDDPKKRKICFSLSGLESYFLPHLFSQLYSCCAVRLLENIARRLVPTKVCCDRKEI